MLIVVVWWLWIQAIGLAALPLAHHFFRRLPDRGYAFARPLGLLLTSYVLWMGGSLGLLRNDLGGALFSLLLVAGISAIVYLRGRREDDPGLLAWLRGHGRLVLAVELLFAAAFGLWALMRAYSPDIMTAGGEKFMEIMYLNSIARSDYFPPHDAWLAGYGISYYYFGYVMIAMLTRLSGFAANLTFNVGLALLFALTCTGAFGLVYNLVKAVEGRARSNRPVAFGFLGAILVAILGNLEGFLEMLYSARLLPQAFWRWLDILELNQPFDPNLAPSLLPARSSWWWWRASRVINDLDPSGQSMGLQPIDEFPGFSFLLGDMHPHVLALPFVLLALAVALNVLLKGSEGSDAPAGWLEPLKRVSLLVPLIIGALGFLNTWDFPIYWLVFVAAYGLAQWRRYGRFNWPFVRDVGVTGGTVAILGFFFYLPFYVGFQSQAGGLLPTVYVGTRFRQYFVMFGPFLVAIAGLLVALLVRFRRRAVGTHLLRGWLGWTAALVFVPVGLMALIVLSVVFTPQGQQLLEGIRSIPYVYDIVGDAPWPSVLGSLLLVKLRTWVMPLVVAAMAALAVVLLQRGLSRSREGEKGAIRERGQVSPSLSPSPKGGKKAPLAPGGRGVGGEGGILSHPAMQFVLLCTVAGLLLTLSVEFFYLTDNFRVRMNTIFKFYFQGWVLMALASAFAVYWLGVRGATRVAVDREETGGVGAAAAGNYGGAPAWEDGGVGVASAGKGEAASGAGGWLRRGFLLGFWLLFVAGMAYPILGNYSRAGQFGHAPNLDGTAYLAQSQPDDYAAVKWLNEHVSGAPIILEAPGTGGSSYVYEGRVSALTGLPTLLGWAGHEGQWRGSYDVQNARTPDIETIYNSRDPQVAASLLDKYGVTYVYVGPVERGTYDPRGLEKFGQFMDVVYQQGAVTIYKVRG